MSCQFVGAYRITQLRKNLLVLLSLLDCSHRLKPLHLEAEFASRIQTQNTACLVFGQLQDSLTISYHGLQNNLSSKNTSILWCRWPGCSNARKIRETKSQSAIIVFLWPSPALQAANKEFIAIRRASKASDNPRKSHLKSNDVWDIPYRNLKHVVFEANIQAL